MRYIVQPGDTPMSIARKLSGSHVRVGELVTSNPHKARVAVATGTRHGVVHTFRDLVVGEHLTVPPRWKGPTIIRRHHQGGGGRGMGQGQPSRQAPHFAVRPSAQHEDGEPILTVSGVGYAPVGVGHCGSCGGQAPLFARDIGKACCDSCAKTGGSCADKVSCSTPKAPISIPGSTSFPVGFGQDSSTTSSTASTVADAVSAWAVPLAIGAVAVAAGFGLAYTLTK